MSWYPATELTSGEVKYLKLLQNIYKVKDTAGDWVPYKMEPHQIEWHSNDVVIKKHNAKTRLVSKSRNTSFTTSAVISQLQAVPHYADQVIPYVRLNKERAIDLIGEEKKLIRQMVPIKLNDGTLYPFNPDEVYMGNAMSIEFPNDVIHRAFPATASASETIRGLRLRGAAGIIDESNFIRDFENVYIALRDASAGSKAGKKEFQINIGTTLKGKMTPFNIWREKILAKKTKAIQYFEWPVFDPNKVDLECPLTAQKLNPIVKWHDVADLEEKREENINSFLEEYMAQLVDADTQFYATDLILNRINDELINELPKNEGFYIGASDIAFVNDYFVISLFEELPNKYIQRYLYMKQRIESEEMENVMENFLKYMIPLGLKKFRIDGNGVGWHIAEKFKKMFPTVVEIIRNPSIKRSGIKISFNEYIHTNQLKLMNKKRIELLNNEMQIHHYTAWDVTYNASNTVEYGHGDSAITNAYVLLPLNWKGGAQRVILSKTQLDDDGKSIKPEKVKHLTLQEKIKQYRKNKH